MMKLPHMADAITSIDQQHAARPCAKCKSPPVVKHGRYSCSVCESDSMGLKNWNHRQVSSLILGWAMRYKEKHGYHPHRMRITAESAQALHKGFRQRIFAIRLEVA